MSPMPPMSQWSFGQMLIGIVILIACVAVVWVACSAMGVVIPGYIVTIFWICVGALVGVVAIKFLLSLLR